MSRRLLKHPEMLQARRLSSASVPAPSGGGGLSSECNLLSEFNVSKWELKEEPANWSPDENLKRVVDGLIDACSTEALWVLFANFKR